MIVELRHLYLGVATCGRFMMHAGTALNSSQCSSASSTPCNQPVTDDCGNDCGDIGTYCEGSETYIQ